LLSAGSIEDLAYSIAGRKRPLEQSDHQSLQSPVKKRGKFKRPFSIACSISDLIDLIPGPKPQAKAAEESVSDTVNDKYSSLNVLALKNACKEHQLSSSKLLVVSFLMA